MVTLHRSFPCAIGFLDPLGKFCEGSLSLQCCSRSITTTLHRIFFVAMLSGASRTILYRVFTFAMLSQKY